MPKEMKEVKNKPTDKEPINNKSDLNKNPVGRENRKKTDSLQNILCDNDADASSKSENLPETRVHVSRSRSKKRVHEGSSKDRSTMSMIAGNSQMEDVSLIRASVDVYMMDGRDDQSEISHHPKPPPGQVPRSARVSSKAR